MLYEVITGVTDDSILIGMEAEAHSFSVNEENLGMRLVMQEVNDVITSYSIHYTKLYD